MAESRIKADIYEYLETLPALTFDRLFHKPATCLAVFRLLPSLGKQIVMSILYNNKSVPSSELESWVIGSGSGKLKEALQHLISLHMITLKNNSYTLNANFKAHFQDALSGGGNDRSFGLPATTTDKHQVDVAFLDSYANRCWEVILHFMVGTQMSDLPTEGVMDLLVRSGLMMVVDRSSHRITNKGFQFLLQDVNTQVWAMLLQYLDTAESLHMDLVEVLHFIFQLGSLELGQNYSIDTLTQTQLQMLDDLGDLGIVYQRKKSSRRYYPTRLATTLTSGTTVLSTSAQDTGRNLLSAGAEIGDEEEKGFLVLETNYRVYAYTNSPLQIAVLNLFVDLKSRFPNMVSGVITRDSVRNALTNGITADQIITFIQAHAHPQMRKKTPLLPLTVIDQIRLWEMERNRIKSWDGFLYREFAQKDDVEATKRRAKELGGLLWAGGEKLVVAASSHASVKSFVTNRISRGREQEVPSQQAVKL
ncbi:hypothetical protein BZG36_04807 [Bifiguratus adelaidae]|uniref:RNA polymerase II transcription factor B subunit 2 n=1 Tax=Bifiguratus adelaidae TaxID=1938954 RepID=A0A261XVA7_9FUNG|nr:hypothetical protein BZG36_04807 [Bifiguratus adelaidae]